MVVDRAWCIVNVGAQCSTEFVFIHEFVCSILGPSLSGISVCSLAASQVSLFLCHSVQSYVYLVYINFEKACCSPKKICVWFVSFFFSLLGEPLTHGTYAMLTCRVTTSLYCIAEPYKRVSNDNVWLQDLALAIESYKKSAC